jgi:hypothetical protein
MYRAGWCLVFKLHDRRADAVPHRLAVVIAGRRELVGPCGTFIERFLAMAFEHQVGSAPNVDIRYHGRKIARLRSLSH